ncbi:MAG TPA: hypothetical protein DET46_11470 [Comamonadaceae bacterium]|nr:MAG: hypothetical protein A3F76_03220 [Burkholderiales bacterium RIFCSPLOWO2_12_FULL_65_40]HCE29278.1 hypothetical protein [Comamonadaceae bacterium]
MKHLAHASAGLLLVQPLQAQWHDAAGHALPQPLAPHEPLRVVVDLIEETHVRIEVPGLMGADRSSFIQVQLQALLPDVALRATWEGPAQQPLLPKPFALHAVGVASNSLNDLLVREVQHQRPVLGVWTLSYLMARWAARQKQLPGTGWLFLCLGLPYGMRTVLLHNRVPVFSRLLIDGHPEQQALEIGQTLKYLVDTRVIDRLDTPAILLMQSPPGLQEAVQAQGRSLLPSPVAPGGPGVLAEVLAMAEAGAPGQLAPIDQRRYGVARQARRALHGVGGVLALLLVAGLVLQARTLQNRVDQAAEQLQQARQTERAAQDLRQKIAASGTHVALLRLTMQVQQNHLQDGVDLASPLWLLGQLLQSQSQAQLQSTELTLLPQACATDAGAQAPQPAPAAATGAAPPLATEWAFEIRPTPGMLPRERQALLDGLAARVQAWPDWTVQTNPVQAESDSAIVGGSAGTSGPLQSWRWCLVPRAPSPEAAAPRTTGANP